MKPLILRIVVYGVLGLNAFQLHRSPSNSAKGRLALSKCLQLCNVQTPAAFRDGAAAELERLRSAGEPTIN